MSSSSSASVSAFAGEDHSPKPAAKDSSSHVSSCSTRSSTRAGSECKGKKQRKPTADAGTADDQVIWASPPQSQIVGPIHLLKLSSPDGSTGDHDPDGRPLRAPARLGGPPTAITSAIPLVGTTMLDSAEPHPEPRPAPAAPHLAKDRAKRKRTPDEQQPPATTTPPAGDCQPDPPPKLAGWNRKTIPQLTSIFIARPRSSALFRLPKRPSHRSKKLSCSHRIIFGRRPASSSKPRPRTRPS
ncbi:hypothetical protein PTTG_27369 [Puccinia triticina 1-1 BBBD Race 1]|uniref:Uncharacterized protein n=2 Tax=Puccinia triticina TaxID=208348 RepID=A0A180GN06_PUCT1|nr:uncharacterized protein PtA15_13A55 [Puccinia triticina]OAV93313.1 hypothetical protein PTTG_27369 [Puccinia triticina 1-1 BBBD Race 1]WAQ90656.1 hypothetical protein PtA15_13A55 [Puccinia triticina]WAR60811.1 hypothetical protein PtB15_13B57 [Puccinia triticina]